MKIRNKRLTSVDVVNIGKSIGLDINVIAKDMPIDQLFQFTVINLDDSSGKGTHWTCYSIYGNDVYYFDSYGAPPPSDIEIQLKHYYDKVYFNTKIIQDKKSILCGWFCLAFLYHMKNDDRIPLDSFIWFTDYFYDETKKNDKRLREYFNHIKQLSK